MSETSDTPTDTASVTILYSAAKQEAPLLFGSLFNWALYGVLTVQIYVYNYNFPNDRRSVKALAYFAFILETIQTALNGADLYFWFIRLEGFTNVQNSHFSPIDIPIFHGIISFIVQIYFCYRIWVLDKRSTWLCVIIAITALTQSAGSLWGGVQSEILGTFVVSRVALYMWALGSAVADILIAVAMTLLLLRTRVKGGKYSTDSLLMRVVRLTIETNVFSAGTAITSIVLYAAYPGEKYYGFTVGITGKIYANTLLVSLNNRIYFRERSSSTHYSSSAQIDPNLSSRLEPASRHVHQIGPAVRAATVGSLDTTVSHAIELERIKDRAVSINSEL